MECCLAAISGCVEYGGERASCGGCPEGSPIDRDFAQDFALLNTVVVEVVVLIVARIGDPQDFVDIIAVNQHRVEHTDALGLSGTIVMDESSPSIWLS